MKKILLVLPLIAGFVSYLLVRDNIDIYDTLNKPPLAPPGIVFSIVWTILYLLMGISSYIISKSNSEYKKAAINIYLLSLIFNFIWSPIFFNHRSFLLSLFIIVLLILLVLGTIRIYDKINKVAAALMIPYLIWLFVAFYLNAGIIVFN